MNKEIIYIGFAFNHHKGTHAGYHQIQDYLGYDKIIDCQSTIERYSSPNIFEKIWRKITRKLFQFPIPWTFIMLKCLFLGWRYNNVAFHFIYGENVFYPLKRFIRKGNQIVCTFHQPLDWFQSNPVFTQHMRDIDKIILVGANEVNDFKSLIKSHNVRFIPHGVCTDFYCPSTSVKKEKLILTVGNWLRDYKFANIVYKELLARDPELRIAIVSNKENRTFIEPNERITFLSGITDEELLELYRKSSVLFLPLIRYTANNSLLEAGASGCNIVIASNSEDNSYIPNEYITITPMQVEATVDTITKKMNFEYNTSLAKFVQNHYSWQTTAKKVKDFILE